MKTFIVVSCLVLAAIAKPQGYVYEKPNNDGLSVSLLLPPSQNQQIPTSFPALSTAHTTQYSNSHSFSSGLGPVRSHGSLGLGSHSSGGSLSLGSSYSVGHGSTVNSFGGSSFGGSSSGGNSFGSSGNSFGSAGSSFGSSGSSFGSSGNSFGSAGSSFGPSGSSFGSSGNSFGSAGSSFGTSGSSFGSGQSLASGALHASAAPSFVPAAAAPSFVSSSVGPAAANTVVQKHIYVHVPPPEEEELVQPHSIAPVTQAQKHYKIIFIKAPSGPSISQQLAQAQIAQQQSEEKTLVYVLVKKPESIEELRNSIPRVPLLQPSKPEVYFIKYKTQTDNGGFSVPVPVSQPIGLSAPVSVGAPIGLTAPSAAAAAADFSSSADLGSISSAAAGAATVVSSSQTSSSTGSIVDTSSSLTAADAANIAAVIQPRTPAPEYGPPKH